MMLPKGDNNKRLIGVTAVLAIAVLLVYGISMVKGGAFKNFCEGAVWWVLIAIGLGTSATYFSQIKSDGVKKKESHR